MLSAPSPMANRKRTEPSQRLGVSQVLESLHSIIYELGSHGVGGDSSTSCPASFSSPGIFPSWNRPPPPKPNAPSTPALWKANQLCISLPHLLPPPIPRDQASLSVSGVFSVFQLCSGRPVSLCDTHALSCSPIMCLSVSVFSQHCRSPHREKGV